MLTCLRINILTSGIHMVGHAAVKPHHGHARVLSRLAHGKAHVFNTMNRTVNDCVPENFGNYKVSPPPMYATAEGKRPFPGRCCTKCSSTSREMLYSPSFPGMGFRNILMFPPGRRNDPRSPIGMHHMYDRKSGLIAKYFPHFTAAISEGYNYEYPPPSHTAEKVLKHKRVQTAIHKCAMSDTEGSHHEEPDYQRACKRQKSRAVAMLVDMAANISNTLLRVVGFVLIKMLSVFLMGVQVHQGQLEMVRQATLQDIPVIVLPMHRSHLDYILMSFILHIYGIRVPYVAAGDNLNIPVFSWFMRRLGAFYIKRKMDRDVGKKDWVYRATLHSYMEDILRSNQNMEFFIEGGRSRSGKALVPKGGLLSVVVDAYMDGVIQDAYLVPVSVSYEKILEGDFNREQMGLPKQKENFFKAIQGILHVLKSNYGHVRVDFAQPFSLKEYMEKAHMPAVPSSDLPVVRPQSPITLKKSASDHSLYGADIVIEDQRQLIKGLGDHVICDAVNVNTVMSTNLVAFLLLTKHRNGVHFSKLVKDADWLKGEIISRGRDVGFTGKTEDVVKHAIKLLGKTLVSVQRPDLCPDVVPQTDGPKDGKRDDIVIPNTQLPGVFELSYYANTVTSVFLMESVLASSVTAVCNQNMLTLKANEHRDIMVSREKVTERAKELCDLLQYEFTFIPPCGHLSTLISDALDQLSLRDILLQEQVQTTQYGGRDALWAKRVAASWEDEDMMEYRETQDEQFQVNTKSESLEYLYFLQSVLGPYVEGYWLSACNLVRLLDQDGPESDFADQVNTYAKDRVAKGLALYAESCAMDTLRNSWKLFGHWKVLDTYHDAEKVKMVQLREPYRTEASLGTLIDRIEAFRT
ncbi:glycerol-3-phosphate acyltransferase 1, mitochondrial-like isoform X2 [Amphiura filiformis]|uniref:glycerol-3-phosphate acyltransferase 1, mitochondrial-like isoform X2 n=1 Tax=Amphiura filiformis TaxID=82378 RepID=UPI003B2192F6